MLLDELKRLKEELEESQKEELPLNEEAEDSEEAIQDEVVEEQPEINEQDEETKEKEPEKPKEEVKEELDNAGYARLRREAAAEKLRAEKLQKEIEELRKAKEETRELEEVTPLSPEIQSIVEEHRVSRAEREFQIYENKIKQTDPGYSAVASEYANAMFQSMKMQNPRKSDVELSDMTKLAILQQAGEFARAGYENPVEELYNHAKSLGFTGKSFAKSEPEPKKEVEEKLQPDLRKVAENRKRSSGMAASHGRAEGQMTITAAADLTAAEWAKLPISEKKRLMYGQ